MAGTESTIVEQLRKAGKKLGKKIWRLQNNNLVIQEKKNIGSFFNAECYFALNVWTERDHLKTDLHAWIGCQASQNQEQKVIELLMLAEDALNDTTIFCQPQFNETREFLDMFPYGIRYLEGNSWQHKQFEQGQYIKRLFKIKGSRNVRIIQVPLGSMSEEESFLLDDEWTIYCWNGKYSPKVGRKKAIEVARMIRDQFCYGKAQIIIADQNINRKEVSLLYHAMDSFEIAPPPPAVFQDNEESLQVDEAKLYKIIDENGKTEVEEIKMTPLTRNMLHTDGLYILNAGKNCLFVWVGRHYPIEEKQTAIEKAMRFLKYVENDVKIPIIRILEDNESYLFKSYFNTWPDQRYLAKDGYLQLIGRDHANKFCTNPISIQEDMIDQADGTIKVWRVEESVAVPWPADYYGMFYEGDVYIIEYQCPITEHYILYIWQSPTSNTGEIENAYLLTQQMDRNKQGCAIQVKAWSRNEPEHFINLFKGKLVILLQKSLDETTNQQETKGRDASFFTITGTSLTDTRAIQIPLDASLLQSNKVYLLNANGFNYIWEGKLATNREKDSAEITADRIAPNGHLLIIKEGFEPTQFWNALGGKVEYNKTKPQDNDGYRKPCLFRCSNGASFKEINPFDQQDLQSDAIMLLMTRNQIFTWTGHEVMSPEKYQYWQIAQKFLEMTNQKKDEICIQHVKQGMETKSFISHFKQWNFIDGQEPMTYSTMKEQVCHENMNRKIDNASFKEKSVTWGDQRQLKRSLYIL